MTTTPGLGVWVIEVPADRSAKVHGPAIWRAPPARGPIGDAVFEGVADRHLIDIFAAIIPFERG